MQDDTNQVMVSNIGINIETIDLIVVFLDSTGFFEITDLVKSPVCLIIVATVVSYGTHYPFSSSIPVPMMFPPFHGFSFRAQIKVI